MSVGTLVIFFVQVQTYSSVDFLCVDARLIKGTIAHRGKKKERKAVGLSDVVALVAELFSNGFYQ